MHGPPERDTSCDVTPGLVAQNISTNGIWFCLSRAFGGQLSQSSHHPSNAGGMWAPATRATSPLVR